MCYVDANQQLQNISFHCNELIISDKLDYFSLIHRRRNVLKSGGARATALMGNFISQAKCRLSRLYGFDPIHVFNVRMKIQ